jgi:type VI secretion system protein VasL
VYVAQAEQQANIEVQAAMPAPVKIAILRRRDVHHAGGKRRDGVGLVPCGLIHRKLSSQPHWRRYLQRSHLHSWMRCASDPRYHPRLSHNQQLARLDKPSPDWNIVWSRQLLEQAQTLWPEQAKPLAQQWQQQLTAASMPQKISMAGIRG